MAGGGNMCDISRRRLFIIGNALTQEMRGAVINSQQTAVNN